MTNLFAQLRRRHFAVAMFCAYAAIFGAQRHELKQVEEVKELIEVVTSYGGNSVEKTADAQAHAHHAKPGHDETHEEHEGNHAPNHNNGGDEGEDAALAAHDEEMREENDETNTDATEA